MTDFGAVFRALKLGHPDHVIGETLGVTSDTIEQAKKDFDEIKELYGKGKSLEETAALLLKDPELVWYAYHVIDTEKEKLEKEAIAEREGKPRIRPPKSTPPKKEEKPEPSPPRGERRKGREFRKEHVDKTIQETAETPTAEVLVGDAGKIGRELAIGRQELGKHVMEATSSTMTHFGYADPIAFFDYIFRFFLDNYNIVQEKDAQIKDLQEANEKLQAIIDEDIVKLFIAKSTDRFATSAHLGKIPVSLEDVEAYRNMLIDFFSSSILGKIELGPDEIARYRRLIDDIVDANTPKGG